MIFLQSNFVLLALQTPSKYSCKSVISKEIPYVLALESVLGYNIIEEKGFQLCKNVFLFQKNVKDLMDSNGIRILVDLLTLAHLHVSRATVPLQVCLLSSSCKLCVLWIQFQNHRGHLNLHMGSCTWLAKHFSNNYSSANAGRLMHAKKESLPPESVLFPDAICLLWSRNCISTVACF